MNVIKKIAALYLICLSLIFCGFMIAEYTLFPYSHFMEVKEFIQGHSLGDDTSTVDKFKNDFGISPARYFKDYPQNAINKSSNVEISELSNDREMPLMYISPDHMKGYRAIFGAFDFNNSFWGGILLSPEGRIIHRWKLNADANNEDKINLSQRYLYGLHLFQDGSVIFLFDDNTDEGGIFKINPCSDIEWSLKGDFHHTISPTEDGYFWTFGGEYEDFDHKLIKISQETGEINTIIDMAKIREINQYIHIFNLQRSLKGPHDIEPLPSSIAQKFKIFNAGDILISFRTQNLIFVLDPETYLIKWWRIGAWDRQHDPDWENDGSITVFSNNDVTLRQYSDIVSINPDTLNYKVIVNGEKFNFYSKFRGVQQITDFNTIFITSGYQGWAFEVDQNDEIVFSFVNNFDRKQLKSYNLSEAVRLPDNYFEEEFWNKCSE